MTKLNLGCGRKHKKGYVNIDIQKPCDLKLNLTAPLPFKNNSIDEIFSENTIQLLSRKEWERLKTEIGRVLKPGGKIEIRCDDFVYVIEKFLTSKEDEKWGHYLMCIFSGQGNEFDYFKNAFTYDKLVADFKEEGMGAFERIFTQEDTGWIHFKCKKPL